MLIRPMTTADVPLLCEIDGTIESARYLHVERTGDGLAVAFSLEERALRERMIDANRLGDEQIHLAKSFTSGIDEGIALVAEHDGGPVAMTLAQADPASNTLRLLDLRVDYDVRREGLATAMLYQLVGEARQRGLRAVFARTTSSNHPANQLLLKCAFSLAGLDTHHASNHDLVREQVAMLWYAALD